MTVSPMPVWDRTAIAVVTVAAVTVLLPWGVSAMPGLRADEWAAWIQAVGSIGAIFAAAQIASRQARSQVAQSANERADQVEFRAGLVRVMTDPARELVKLDDAAWRAKREAELAHMGVRMHAFRMGLADRVRAMAKTLDDLPLTQLSSAEELGLLVAVRQDSQKLVDAARDAALSERCPNDALRVLSTSMDELTAELQAIADRVRAGQSARRPT